MEDEEFLKAYNPSDYERPSVAVDLVLLTVMEGAPQVLLTERQAPPQAGRWALPGSFVAIDETLDDAAARILETRTGLKAAYLEQLYTFGALARDPRMRVLSVAYFALLPVAEAKQAAAGMTQGGMARGALARVSVPWAGEAGGAVRMLREGKVLRTAFDHDEIVGMAMLRLRGKLTYRPIAYAVLPERFTLRELQDVHEAILGRPLNKPAFRRRMLASGELVPTGEREEGSSFRPAELYRYAAGG